MQLFIGSVIYGRRPPPPPLPLMHPFLLLFHLSVTDTAVYRAVLYCSLRGYNQLSGEVSVQIGALLPTCAFLVPPPPSSPLMCV